MCHYIGAPCEHESNALHCAKVSAVECRNKREKLIKQKEKENEQTKVARDS